MDVYILNRRPRRRPPFLCDFSRQFLANRVICTKRKLEIKGRRKKEREQHERTFFYFCTTTHDEQLIFCRSGTYLFTFCVRAKLVFRLFSPQFLQFMRKKAETSRICISVKCRKNVFLFYSRRSAPMARRAFTTATSRTPWTWRATGCPTTR